ncbi:phage head morphogenesis protein [Helicobacter sp. MIT 00-7814]|uniref:phage head morphogenesis protein n=1 Tax=unclassified Helicobacter TaxID=2593540 RepID=UPI000E1E7477|nr:MULTISPECIES: phage minor head protein [unclassified Helicobacter]RDU53279.1 phage head morphogenesis protein [Helicobacter sp. MIT 99-10781]RDU56968.1 phage head morphogenesis protein [Helicobacter sp. MIT 00-7814]
MFSFKLPPIENIAFLQAKDPTLSFDYDEIRHQAHLRAFTIAKVTQIELLSFLQESLLHSLNEGTNFETWKAQISPTLAKAGWLGKSIVTNPNTGEQKEIFVGNRRLKNIYYTNMRTSYTQARAQAQYKLPDSQYLRYVCVGDNRVRQSHRALHGLILHRDDPFWQRNYPPNAWNCRCRVQSYSLEQIQARGWEVTKSAPNFQAHKDWDYDTRNLKNTQDNLQAIISKKLQKLANNKTATECLQDLSKQIQENASKYRELKELWDTQDKQRVMQLLKTPSKLQELFKNSAPTIQIRASTIDDHKPRHPEISVFDYSLISYMLDDIDSIYQDSYSDKKYIIASKLGKWYRLSLKSLADKKEIWVESLLSVDEKETLMKNLKNKSVVYKKS